MKTHADKTHENRNRSLADKPPQKQRPGASAFQFVGDRTETIDQRKLQEMANKSPQAAQLKGFRDAAQKSHKANRLTQLQPITHDGSGQQVIQMVRRVIKESGEIEEVGDDYQLGPEETFLGRVIEYEEAHHRADLARFRELRTAKAKGPIMEMGPSNTGGSATLSHLRTPFVNEQMRPRQSLMHGVEARFLTPTIPAIGDQGPKKRQISPEQVEKYKEIGSAAIANEKLMHNSHYAFYHAQDPRMRVAQDVYKRVYERHHQRDLPRDFHFLRFPGPADDEFKKHENVQSYFEEDMAAHGMIDDNITPTKTHLTSVNPALHGGLGHAGEETFHYFQIGQGQTELPVAAIMGDFLEKFGLGSADIEKLYKDASALNATKEGSLFQIMVPKEKVDSVAYMAHPHGLPHDDELFDDLHEMGEIRYPIRPDVEKQPGLPPREKMNDEVSRNLVNMRKEWQKQDAVAGKNALIKRKTVELNQRTLARFRGGAYRPSRHLEELIHDPGKLQHPEGHAQKLRMEMNPDHFGGQGVRSPHELMRIQNRSTFMQARLHFSESTTLNPDSGISIKRFTTMEPEAEEAYNQMLDSYVDQLFANKPIKEEDGRRLLGSLYDEL